MFKKLFLEILYLLRIRKRPTMPIVVDGVTITDVVMDGTVLAAVTMDGVVVFRRGTIRRFVVEMLFNPLTFTVRVASTGELLQTCVVTETHYNAGYFDVELPDDIGLEFEIIPDSMGGTWFSEEGLQIEDIQGGAGTSGSGIELHQHDGNLEMLYWPPYFPALGRVAGIIKGTYTLNNGQTYFMKVYTNES